ncbi:hypothetical protein V6N13_064278 [Hibiscus sabdariffa]|uniref:Uncharacterized protein n=1 Tax=Hibiscus sabdariffa TaxID=183260 RepID=A0ABR2E9H2_9ROSI
MVVESIERAKCNFFEWIDPSEFSEIQYENGNEEMEEEKQNLLSEIKGIRNEIACLKENGSVEEINNLMKEIKK